MRDDDEVAAVGVEIANAREMDFVCVTLLFRVLSHPTHRLWLFLHIQHFSAPARECEGVNLLTTPTELIFGFETCTITIRVQSDISSFLIGISGRMVVLHTIFLDSTSFPLPATHVQVYNMRMIQFFDNTMLIRGKKGQH
jgi:hypothetical protein